MAAQQRTTRRSDLLFGRDDDLAALDRWWRGGGRVLALVGPPGVGKTVLARALVAELREGGATTREADLTGAGADDDVLAALARAVGVRAPSDVELDQAVAVALTEAGVEVLWLDGPPPGGTGLATVVGDLLEACPDLRVLVSSQQRPRLSDQSVHPVAPLAAHAGGGDEVAPGVAMWIDRVRRLRPDYAPEAPELAVVTEIVERLDGLPLAIELAAGRMALLDAPGIRARLEDRFTLLAGGAHGTTEPHETLRAALEWAFSHLSAEEEVALAQCAIFAGAFAVDAAEAVVRLPEGARAGSLLDVLHGLVDRSLLHPVSAPGGRRRLRLLHSVRELAALRLAESDQAAATVARHAAFFAGEGARLRASPAPS